MVLRPGTPLTVSVVVPPDGTGTWVCLAGDVDMVGEPVLADAIDRLADLPVGRVIVDVAAVTFASSTLVHFLEDVHEAHPDTPLVMRHASPMVRFIIKVTGLDWVTVVNGDPEPPSMAPPGELDCRPPGRFAHRSTASRTAGPRR